MMRWAAAAPGPVRFLTNAYEMDWRGQPLAARQNRWRPGGDGDQPKLPHVSRPRGQLLGRGDVRHGALSAGSSDYFLRRVPGHAGRTGGAAAEPRHGVWRVLRFHARPLFGHGAVHGTAG